MSSFTIGAIFICLIALSFYCLFYLYKKFQALLDENQNLSQMNRELFKENLKFNHIFEDNVNPVLVLDDHFEVVKMNKAYLSAFDQSLTSFVDQVLAVNGEDMVKNMLEKMKNRHEMKFSFKTEEGDNSRHFNCYLTPFKDDDIVYYLANFIEKTDLIIKNQQLEKITQRALELAKKKSEFMASVSHELRTPLNGIIGLSDSLLDTVSEKQDKDLVAVIHDSGVHLLQLINNILDFSKLEADKVELETIPVSLEDLSQSVYATLAEVAKKKGIVLNIHIDDKLPSNLMMDKLRISQVLFNLIGNSIKFTDTGSVDLFIQQVKAEDEYQHVLFSIKDTGIGMDEAGVNNLFQAFSQADATISRKYGGTGLGLSISKKIVDLYHSQIHVESELGKGSHFYFEVKLKEAKNAKIKQDEILVFNGSEIPLKILVAEDNQVNRLVAKKYFEKIGYKNVDFAENGLVAFEMAKENNYDVIFMDMQMPEVDGIESTKMIFEELDFFSAPIIVAMTANSELEDRKRCMEAGMSDFITKPLNANDIKKVILKHFSQLKKSA